MKILIIIPITGLKKKDIEEKMVYLRSVANPGAHANSRYAWGSHAHVNRVASVSFDLNLTYVEYNLG